jgi:hypothetical protein
MLGKVQQQHHDYLELQPVLPPLHYYFTAEVENSLTLFSTATRWRCCFLGRGMGRREGA